MQASWYWHIFEFLDIVKVSLDLKSEACCKRKGKKSFLTKTRVSGNTGLESGLNRGAGVIRGHVTDFSRPWVSHSLYLSHRFLFSVLSHSSGIPFSLALIPIYPCYSPASKRDRTLATTRSARVPCTCTVSLKQDIAYRVRRTLSSMYRVYSVQWIFLRKSSRLSLSGGDCISSPSARFDP